MAEVEKFTDSGVMMLLKHSDRQLKNDSNTDIVSTKSDLNYSIKIERNGLTPRQFYKEIKNESYLYGRGTLRESKAITCCGWVITLPREVSDYTTIGKDEIKILNPDAENAFFSAVTQFVSERYGTVFYNRVHYDEDRQPHIHIYFVPQTKLDHDLVHYKTIKTKKAVKTESGRYEYVYRYKFDKNGEKIPLKNYARTSDYYETKISAAEVLNREELLHFHGDLAKYLTKNNIPGASYIYTGKTGNNNISVKSLKEFTKSTGITIDELKEQPLQKDVLKKLLDSTNLKPSIKNKIVSINEEAATKNLNLIIQKKDQEISNVTEQNLKLEKKVAEIKNLLHTKQNELDQARSHISDLEEKIKSFEKSNAWGTESSGWNKDENSHSNYGWGKAIDEEKLW